MKSSNRAVSRELPSWGCCWVCYASIVVDLVYIYDIIIQLYLCLLYRVYICICVGNRRKDSSISVNLKSSLPNIRRTYHFFLTHVVEQPDSILHHIFIPLGRCLRELHFKVRVEYQLLYEFEELRTRKQILQ